MRINDTADLQGLMLRPLASGGEMAAINLLAGIATGLLIFRFGYVAGRRNGNYEAGREYGKTFLKRLAAYHEERKVAIAKQRLVSLARIARHVITRQVTSGEEH